MLRVEPPFAPHVPTLPLRIVWVGAVCTLPRGPAGITAAEAPQHIEALLPAGGEEPRLQSTVVGYSRWRVAAALCTTAALCTAAAAILRDPLLVLARMPPWLRIEEQLRVLPHDRARPRPGVLLEDLVHVHLRLLLPVTLALGKISRGLLLTHTLLLLQRLVPGFDVGHLTLKRSLGLYIQAVQLRDPRRLEEVMRLLDAMECFRCALTSCGIALLVGMMRDRREAVSFPNLLQGGSTRQLEDVIRKVGRDGGAARGRAGAVVPRDHMRMRIDWSRLGVFLHVSY